MKTSNISTKRYSAENFMLLKRDHIEVPKASEMDKLIAKARKKAVQKELIAKFGKKRVGNKQFTYTSKLA